MVPISDVPGGPENPIGPLFTDCLIQSLVEGSEGSENVSNSN